MLIGSNINTSNNQTHNDSPALSSSNANNSFIRDLDAQLNISQFSLNNIKPGEDIKFKDNLFSEGAFYSKGFDNLIV